MTSDIQYATNFGDFLVRSREEQKSLEKRGRESSDPNGLVISEKELIILSTSVRPISSRKLLTDDCHELTVVSDEGTKYRCAVTHIPNYYWLREDMEFKKPLHRRITDYLKSTLI